MVSRRTSRIHRSPGGVRNEHPRTVANVGHGYGITDTHGPGRADQPAHPVVVKLNVFKTIVEYSITFNGERDIKYTDHKIIYTYLRGFEFRIFDFRLEKRLKRGHWLLFCHSVECLLPVLDAFFYTYTSDHGTKWTDTVQNLDNTRIIIS